jgi:hypothetical protein
MLRLIAEQGAIPFDQLGRFLEAEDHQVKAVASHLTKLGYADYGSFLHGEPHWIWLTYRGCSLSGTGFSFLPPRVGAMARVRAVNEIRLHITRRAPGARWICGRTLFREQGHRGHRPSAVVEIDGERHAILALLRPKRKERLLPILEAHHRRYDALIVFAASRARGQVSRLTSEHRLHKLVIRELPVPPE